MENTEKKVVREQHKYDTDLMTVFAWGNTFAYWRYDVKDVPEEVKLYCLKGFIDDLQDCTTGIKKADYKKTPEGADSYRLDCLQKRRELERNINAGLKPVRANASDKTSVKAELVAAKSMNALMAKKLKGEVLDESEELFLQVCLARM